MKSLASEKSKFRIAVVAGACAAGAITFGSFGAWNHLRNPHIKLAKQVSVADPIRPAPNLPIPYVLPLNASGNSGSTAPVPWTLCGIGDLNLASPNGDAIARQFERDVMSAEAETLASMAAEPPKYWSTVGEETRLFLRHFSAVLTDLRTAKKQLQGTESERALAVTQIGEVFKIKLAELVKVQPTDKANALLWAMCARELANGHESQACLSHKLSDWAKLSPQSTAPLFAMLTSQVLRHPRQDPWPIMEAITQAKDWPRLPFDPFAAAWALAPLGETRDPQTRPGAATRAYALRVLLMQGLELYPVASPITAYQLCKAPDSLTTKQRATCGALALQMSTANTSLSNFMMAESLGHHLKWPQAQLDALQAQLQQHYQFPERLLGGGSGFGCQAVKNGPAYIQSVLQFGEMATLRGQSPISMRP